MSLIAFDTHSFVKRLTASGMPEAQAEVLAENQTALLDEKLATKSDLDVLRVDIREFKAAVKSDLSQMATKADLSQMATKADISQMATKADLSQMATKADLAQFLTKDDLVKIEARFTSIDARFTAIDSRFATIDARFASIDVRFAQIEGKIVKLEWMLGIVIAGVGALLVKAFLH